MAELGRGDSPWSGGCTAISGNWLTREDSDPAKCCNAKLCCIAQKQCYMQANRTLTRLEMQMATTDTKARAAQAAATDTIEKTASAAKSAAKDFTGSAFSL